MISIGGKENTKGESGQALQWETKDIRLTLLLGINVSAFMCIYMYKYKFLGYSWVYTIR